MHHERVTNTRTYTRAESQSRAFTKRRTSSGDNVCMEELSCRVPSIPPRIAAFTRAMKLENGDHDLDDTFKASTTVLCLSSYHLLYSYLSRLFSSHLYTRTRVSQHGLFINRASSSLTFRKPRRDLPFRHFSNHSVSDESL